MLFQEWDEGGERKRSEVGRQEEGNKVKIKSHSHRCQKVKGNRTEQNLLHQVSPSFERERERKRLWEASWRFVCQQEFRALGETNHSPWSGSTDAALCLLTQTCVRQGWPGTELPLLPTIPRSRQPRPGSDLEASVSKSLTLHTLEFSLLHVWSSCAVFLKKKVKILLLKG